MKRKIIEDRVVSNTEGDNEKCNKDEADSTCSSLVELEFSRLKEEKSKLKETVLGLQLQVQDYTLDREYLSADKERLQFCTGLPSIGILGAVFGMIQAHLSHTTLSMISKFQQMILFLMRVRLNLSLQDHAYRFRISCHTASRILSNVFLCHVT